MGHSKNKTDRASGGHDVKKIDSYGIADNVDIKLPHWYNLFIYIQCKYIKNIGTEFLMTPKLEWGQLSLMDHLLSKRSWI